MNSYKRGLCDKSWEIEGVSSFWKISPPTLDQSGGVLNVLDVPVLDVVSESSLDGDGCSGLFLSEFGRGGVFGSGFGVRERLVFNVWFSLIFVFVGQCYYLRRISLISFCIKLMFLLVYSSLTHNYFLLWFVGYFLRLFFHFNLILMKIL